jgi:polyisoprenoid-binding protein YceI
MFRMTLLSALVLSTAAFAQTKTYDFDMVHSGVSFDTTHMTVSTVSGKFASWTGTFAWDDKDLSKAKLAVTLQPASVDTGAPKRDEHLRNADFFEVAKYSNAVFTLKGVKAAGNSYTATADLTMKGVTKTYTFPLTLTPEMQKPDFVGGGFARGLSGSFTLKRSDFTLGPKLPAMILADDVVVKFSAELTRK